MSQVMKRRVLVWLLAVGLSMAGGMAALVGCSDSRAAVPAVDSDADIRQEGDPAAEPAARVSDEVAPEAANLALPPFLQLGGIRGRDAVVSWRTPEPAESWVEYWLGEESPQRRGNADLLQQHSVTLQGLLPDTVYHYRVLSGPFRSAGCSFRTLPKRESEAGTSSPFMFVVYGDNRSYPERHRAVINSIVAGPQPWFVLSTGDLVESGEDDWRWEREFFGPGGPLFCLAPAMVLLGNHDLDDTTRPRRPPSSWQELFVFPLAEGAPAHGRWYSFDAGGIHLVCLDSNTPHDLEQIAWLAEDLASPEAKGADFIIVSYHHPSYTAGKHASNLATREAWEPLFTEHGVDLVFNGHNHFYQRTYPILAGQPDVSAGEMASEFPAGSGTVYCVSGGGGAPLYDPHEADFIVLGVKAFHHVRVSYQPGRLMCEAVDLAGQVFDQFILVKGGT